MRTWAQVIPTVIETVAVSMVNLWEFVASSNRDVHGKSRSLAANIVGSHGVPQMRSSLESSGTPLPLHQPLVISGIDDSNLALREGDMANRLVLRLNHLFKQGHRTYLRCAGLAALFFIVTSPALAQSSFQPGSASNITQLAADPSPCSDSSIWYNFTTNQYKICPGGVAQVIGTGTGSGTVTSVSVTTANGVSGTVATATTTPAISLTLGAITPSTVNGQTISAGSGTLALGASSLTLGTSGINFGILGTGIVKNTTTTGNLTNAASADVIALFSGTCNSGTFLNGAGACAAGNNGTVTSVTATGDGIFDSATPSSAVTTSGTLTLTAIQQAANCVFAGPATGPNANPSCRALVTADLPAGTTPISSISNSDGTLTISPTTGVVVASLALGHANAWGGQQTFVAPVLGTPASGVATNLTGLPISTGLTGAGTGVLAALANPTNAASGLLTFSGAFGTPTSLTLTNATGLSLATGVTGQLPIGSVGSAGLSGTSPITINSSGAIGCATCVTGNPALSSVTALVSNTTLANGNNTWTLNSAQTSNTQSAVSFGETSAATGGSANNEVSISTAANSTSTALNVTQGAISTVFPTAAVAIVQGANTGATNVPVLSITTTQNNASLTGGVVNIAVTNTASAGTQSFFNLLSGAAAGTTEGVIDLAGNFKAAGSFESTTTAGNSTVAGGAGSASTNGAVGGTLIQGSHNSSNGSSVKAGYAILTGGLLSNATPNAAALEGVVQIQAGYLKGTAIANIGDVVCGTTTAFTVTDCGLAAANIIGIADTTTNPIGVIGYGTALVKFDGATTLGDTACGPPTSTGTAGLAHDNGTTACVLGSSVGVIIANSGTITVASATTTAAVAMSSTLALVQLHISQ